MAALHAGLVVVGPAAYRRFGGTELARQAEAGSWAPAIMVSAIALLFAVFALYAFAGAQARPRLPLLRTVLVLVSLLYGVHGLFLLPELVARLSNRPSPAPSDPKTDAIFLARAVPYCVGTLRGWRELSERVRRSG